MAYTRVFTGLKPKLQMPRGGLTPDNFPEPR